MPSQFQLTPRALNDFDEICGYIAEDSVNATNRLESAIVAAGTSLARHPLLGVKRTEITLLPVRFWAVNKFPNFIVVYRPDTKPLRIISVLHGKRDIKTVLDGRS